MNITYENRRHAFMAGYNGLSLKEAFVTCGVDEVGAYNDGRYARDHGKGVEFFERQQESIYGRFWDEGFSVVEGDHFIGHFTLETAPNPFLAALMREAAEHGHARGTDKEGCIVTVSVDD